MRHLHQTELQFTFQAPYGALIRDGGVQFVVFSRSAKAMRVLLYDHVDDLEPARRSFASIPMRIAGETFGARSFPISSRANSITSRPKGLTIRSVACGSIIRPGWSIPYAKALAGTFQRSDDGVIRPPKCVIVDDHFNWEGDRHLRRPLAETVIYEMHVRGFTQNANSGVENPGTYLGVIEKIPYLKSLGVTAVELMPVHEFPIKDINGNMPERPNYWGYDPLAFFAPHRGYAAGESARITGRRVQDKWSRRCTRRGSK